MMIAKCCVPGVRALQQPCVCDDAIEPGRRQPDRRRAQQDADHAGGEGESCAGGYSACLLARNMQYSYLVGQKQLRDVPQILTQDILITQPRHHVQGGWVGG